MYDPKTDTPANARTSTLNEELGQVQYVFSDKTGTLTQNVMVFKKCSINGRSYGDFRNERGDVIENIDENTLPGIDFSFNRWHEKNFKFYDKTLLIDTVDGLKEVQEFWRLLAICHTVMPEGKGDVLEYQAQSPDEAALTSAARNFGFVFRRRTPQTITLEVNGRTETYDALHILDFDNVRKRMSVLVRTPNNQIRLYCKGADTMIMERLSEKDTSQLLRQATLQHLDKFATDGLRTLCVAYKIVDGEYCEKWLERLHEALIDLENKDKRVDALYEEMECDMILLGATAIEDKLQDGVPQTIAALADANIKLWVLTGDKTETAINIAFSCGLLTEYMREVSIIDGKDEKEVEVQLKDTIRRMQNAKVPQVANENGHLNVGKLKEKETLLSKQTEKKNRQKNRGNNDPEKHSGKTCESVVETVGEEENKCSDECFDNVQNYIAQQIALLEQCEVAELIEQEKQVLEENERRKRKLKQMRNSRKSQQVNNVFDEQEKEHCSKLFLKKFAFDEEIRQFKWITEEEEEVEDLKEEGKTIIFLDGGDNEEIILKDDNVDVETVVGVSSFYLPPRTPIRELSPSPTELPQNPKDASSRPLSPIITSPTTDRQQSRRPTEMTTIFPASLMHEEGLGINGTSNILTARSELPGNNLTPTLAGPTSDDLKEGSGGYALVINGESLVHALKTQHEKIFLEIARNCTSVICCRVTPLQKAKVVELVKRNIKAVTLAIGDGANDVSMIRTAHIGVGISATPSNSYSSYLWVSKSKLK
uniref:P-type phospholipid transporter n=1 Tax=Meloidogyne javanica TaxID=6303 RepID=A0A915LD06_MELJA